jgi:phosphopantothenoylcysteine synthetase/decarboxylase
MKIFITSGNTWVRIDPVRVITNIFTGETGLNIANYLCEKREEVILAGSNTYLFQLKGNPLIKFKLFQYFEDLDSVIKNTILTEKPDVIIHAAAVSDYRPKIEHPKKIKSNSDEIDLGKWVPTKKLIHSIRKEYNFQGKLVQFKLETVSTDEQLIEIAKKSMISNQSNLCIANRMNAMEDVIAVYESGSQKMKRSDLYSYLHQWVLTKS